MSIVQSIRSFVRRCFLICFLDIDECATETHKCRVYEMCNNTRGSHNCTREYIDCKNHITQELHTLFCHTNEMKIQYKITRKVKWRGDLKETIESL